MNAKEQYNQRLDELAEAQLTSTLQVGDTVYDLNTDEGWEAYGRACEENVAAYWRNLAQESLRPTP